jgi:hypothetical protein
MGVLLCATMRLNIKGKNEESRKALEVPMSFAVSPQRETSPRLRNFHFPMIQTFHTRMIA